MISRISLLFVVVLLFFPNVVSADEKDSRIYKLEKQVEILMQEIAELKKEKQPYKIDTKKLKNDISLQDIEIKMKPSPKIEAGDFSWQPFGRMHLDYASFADDRVDHPNGAEFRRMRLGMKGNIAADFAYKAELEFANEALNFRDVYISYTGLKNTEFKIGSFKPPFGLEELTSSNNITFIERSAPTAAFISSYIIGVGASKYSNNWSLTAGLFNDDAGTQSTDDEAWSTAVRATYLPIFDDEKLIHLGASAVYRKPDQAGDSFDFDAKAENALQTTDSVSANFGNADNAKLYGLELAGMWKNFSIQGEYFLVDVERLANRNSLDFSGGYVQASWILTGEMRKYNNKKAVFGGVKPLKAFNMADGSFGAFELAARYSKIDVTDKDILGGKMSNYSLGANWYLNNNLRFMANYIFVDTDGSAVSANDNPQILLLRTQISF